MRSERPCFVGGRRYDATPHVVAQRFEAPPHCAGCRIDRLFGLVPAAAADDHGLTPQLGIAEELDRRVKRVHVEMRDQAAGHGDKV